MNHVGCRGLRTAQPATSMNAVLTAGTNLPAAIHRQGGRLDLVFLFFSNRLGCLGSIAVSVVLSVLLIATMRACAAQ